MKLGPRDIDSFLKAPDKQAGAVLIYGPDGGLVRDRSRHIAKLLLGKDADPLNHMDLISDQVKADPAILRDELSAMSLMGGRRVITIRDAADKIAHTIEEAFEGLNTTTYLIVEGGELATSSALRKLFEGEARFAALACYRNEGRNLEEAIRGGLTGAGLRVTPDAISYLSHNLGNDHGVTQSEIEKIILYMGKDKELTLELAMELTGQNSSETMEDVCHAVASGNAREVYKLVSRMLHEGTQPVAIIRSLMRHFQRLDIATAQIQTGMSAEQAIAQLRPPVFFKYIPVMKRELSRMNARTLAQILNLLLKAEKDLKSSLLSPHLLASQTIQQAARMAA
jgi:DNA polymerase-3 subunit delta